MGWSGSGKTTLLVAVLPLLRAAGLRVSTIKHAHHGLELDRPGKDSFRHREAGAEEVLVVGGQRWALLREATDAPDPVLLASRLAPVDLVLVEGFKSSGLPQIEVHRLSIGKPPLWPTAPAILAVAADAPPAAMPGLLPQQAWLPLNDPAVVARWITDFVRRPDAAA